MCVPYWPRFGTCLVVFGEAGGGPEGQPVLVIEGDPHARRPGDAGTRLKSGWSVTSFQVRPLSFEQYTPWQESQVDNAVVRAESATKPAERRLLPFARLEDIDGLAPRFASVVRSDNHPNAAHSAALSAIGAPMAGAAGV